MSNKAITIAYEIQTGSPTLKAVLVALADFANPKDNSCFPSISTISRMTELSEASVKRAIRKLEEMGFITREVRSHKDGRNTSNLYKIFPNIDFQIVDKSVARGSHRPPPPVTVTPSPGHSDPPLKRTLIEPLDNHNLSSKLDRSDLFKKITEDLKEIPEGTFQFPDAGDVETYAVYLLYFLNIRSGYNFKPVDGNLKMIIARLREGYSHDDLGKVIANKANQWSDDPDMKMYLRPKTLFNATNFANYEAEEFVMPGKGKTRDRASKIEGWCQIQNCGRRGAHWYGHRTLCESHYHECRRRG